MSTEVNPMLREIKFINRFGLSQASQTSGPRATRAPPKSLVQRVCPLCSAALACEYDMPDLTKTIRSSMAGGSQN